MHETHLTISMECAYVHKGDSSPPTGIRFHLKKTQQELTCK
jgi:hypothetical protein